MFDDEINCDSDGDSWIDEQFASAAKKIVSESPLKILEREFAAEKTEKRKLKSVVHKVTNKSIKRSLNRPGVAKKERRIKKENRIKKNIRANIKPNEVLNHVGQAAPIATTVAEVSKAIPKSNRKVIFGSYAKKVLEQPLTLEYIRSLKNIGKNKKKKLYRELELQQKSEASHAANERLITELADKYGGTKIVEQRLDSGEQRVVHASQSNGEHRQVLNTREQRINSGVSRKRDNWQRRDVSGRRGKPRFAGKR